MSDNFDLRKYLVENKVTTNSKMIKEENQTPSDGMHQVILSYIKPDFRDRYPKSYDKYWLFLRANSKPVFGSNNPEIFMKFLKDLIKNKVVTLDALNTFAEKYNDGRGGLEGLAYYLYKQGSPDIIEKIDNLGEPTPKDDSIQETKDYTTYEPSTFRKPSGYKEEVEQIKNLIKKTYPEYVNSDIGNVMDADMELRVLAWKVYGINISVKDAYTILLADDPSELPKELISKWNKIETLTGEPMLALRQAMEELNIEA